MFPWLRLAAGAAVVVAAYGAGWFSNGWRIEAAAARQERTERAEQEASNATIIEAYRAELDRTRNRPARRVFICPDLPAAAGPANNTDQAGVGRSIDRDVGPVLAEARDELIRCKSLIAWLREQS